MQTSNESGETASQTYPDSVNLVKPPQTTIPKTLTALPISQYPTTLEFVSGKDDDFGGASVVGSLGMAVGVAAVAVAILRLIAPAGSDLLAVA